MNNWLWRVGLLPALCITIVGCASGESGEEVGVQEEVVFQASQAELLADPRISDGQREALRDGEVDLAELETAGLEFENCMQDLGFSVEFIIEASGDYSVEGSVPEGLSIEEFERLEEGCEISSVKLVARQYSFQRRLPAEVRQARSEHFRQCLDSSDRPELPEVEAACWDESVEVVPVG